MNNTETSPTYTVDWFDENISAWKVILADGYQIALIKL